jgi:hypothetical protein
VLAEAFSRLCRTSPKLKKALWKGWYQFLARSYPRRDWSFMNYGYASLDDDAPRLRLSESDEDNRYFIQLYHHVVSAVPLRGQQVLEVGSGRGCGAEYIKRCLAPREMIGVDLSQNAVALCNRRYAAEPRRWALSIGVCRSRTHDATAATR